MAFWGPGFFEAPSSRTNTFSAATGCAAVMGRSVGNVPAALTFLPSSVYWIPSKEKGLETGFRKHGRVSGNTTAGPVVSKFLRSAVNGGSRAAKSAPTGSPGWGELACCEAASSAAGQYEVVLVWKPNLNPGGIVYR